MPGSALGYISLTAMKKTHVAALVCFALALLLYIFGSSNPGAGGFVFLGFIFELMAWKNVSDSSKEK
jgi:uncharacterized integral membrane protein